MVKVIIKEKSGAEMILGVRDSGGHVSGNSLMNQKILEVRIRGASS